MALVKEHELHRRRFRRNLALGLTLAAFIAIVFGLTIVKIAGMSDTSPTRTEAQ